MPVNIPGYSTRRRRVEHIEKPVEYETLPPQETDPAAPATYDVGYGKPPKDTQWKPGQSGNPKGRPKGSRNLDTIIREIIFEPVAVRFKGKATEQPRIEVALRQQMKSAMEKGDRLSLLAVLRFLPFLKHEEKQEDEPAIPEHELAALENLLALRRGGGRRARDEQA